MNGPSVESSFGIRLSRWKSTKSFSRWTKSSPIRVVISVNIGAGVAGSDGAPDRGADCRMVRD
jgi:hypothetical protein